MRLRPAPGPAPAGDVCHFRLPRTPTCRELAFGVWLACQSQPLAIAGERVKTCEAISLRRHCPDQVLGVAPRASQPPRCSLEPSPGPAIGSSARPAGL